MDSVSVLPVLLNAQAQAAESAGGGIHWALTILIFIGMLVVLVFVHELGHFLTALWMGIRVEEFGIGFPPRALTLFRHQGVDYTLNWLPLGGFVRFAGEGDIYSGGPAKDAPVPATADQESTSSGGMMLTEAPPWRKIPVMFAGPFANFLAAILIFAVMFVWNGIPTPVGQRVGEVFADTPAQAAGFQEGDIIVELDGQPVGANLDAVKDIAQENVGQTIEAVVLRDGEQITLTAMPGEWQDESGSEHIGLGFRYGREVEYMTVNPLVALIASIEHTGQILVMMVNGLGQMIGGLFGANEPPPGGVAGPVGIARATGEVIDAGGFVGFWNWMAIISLNLFLLNLLPIPALDGSHIFFALLEIVRGGKKVPPEKEAMVHAIGFAALMGLIVLVTISDVWNVIQGVPVIPGQ